MKAVTTHDLRHQASTDELSKARQSVEKEAEQVKRKTFSIHAHHVRLINATAGRLSKERDGELVTASEALRHLLDGLDS